MKTAILIIASSWYMLFNTSNNNQDSTQQQGEYSITMAYDSVIDSLQTNKPIRPTINIKPNQVISSPVHIRVDSEGLWPVFEGELGIVQLVDEKGNNLSNSILFTEGGKSTLFSTHLKFIPKGMKRGKLIIHNNMGGSTEEGNLKPEKFEIPVQFE